MRRADSEAASASWPIALAANLSLRLESRGADPGPDPQLAVASKANRRANLRGGTPGWSPPRLAPPPQPALESLPAAGRAAFKPAAGPWRGPFCQRRWLAEVGPRRTGTEQPAAGTANLNTLRACMGAWEAHAAHSYHRRRGGMVIVAKQAQRKDRVHAGLSLVVPMYERRIPSELDRAHQTHVHVAAGYLLPMLLSALISALTSQRASRCPGRSSQIQRTPARRNWHARRRVVQLPSRKARNVAEAPVAATAAVRDNWSSARCRQPPQLRKRRQMISNGR